MILLIHLNNYLAIMIVFLYVEAFANKVYLNILRDYFARNPLFFLNLFLVVVYPSNKGDFIGKAVFDKPNVIVNTV